MATFKDGYVQAVMTVQIVMTVDVAIDGISLPSPRFLNWTGALSLYT